MTGSARAADVDVGVARGARDVATLTARQAVLGEQADVARAATRWRLRALRRLVVAGDALDGATRARALDAGTRALARELAEGRSLVRERDQLRTERDTLAASAGQDQPIGAPPAFALPVAGAVVARFGVAPDRATGLLVARAGLRLATAPGAAVKAPAAGVVALVAAEPEGAAIVLDAGAGWTAIVSGLAETSVTAGARVAAGEPLGRATAAPAAVSFEIWRGRHPVDPLLLVRAAPPPRPTVPGPEALAAPPNVP